MPISPSVMIQEKMEKKHVAAYSIYNSKGNKYTPHTIPSKLGK